MVREVKEENINNIKTLGEKTFDKFLKEECSRECEKSFKSYLSDHLKNDSSWYYLLDDKEISFISVKDNNHITACFTEENYQDKGAATELFEAVKAILMARGVFTITTDAPKSAITFFEKLGFEAKLSPEDCNSCCIPMEYRF